MSRIFLMSVLSLILYPVLGQAQPLPCTGNDVNRLSVEGAELASQNRLAEAATCFDRAYTLGHNYAMLFNAGRIYETLGRQNLAMLRYRAWLQERDRLTDEQRQRERPEFRRMVDEFLSHYRPAQARPTPEVTPPIATPVNPTPVAPPNATVPVQPLSSSGTSTPHPAQTVSRRIFPWGPAIFMGIGALAMGLGVFWGVEAENYRGLVNNARTWTPEVDTAYQAIDPTRIGMGVSLGLGAALATAGVIWLAAGHWSRPEQLRATPTLSLGGAGLRLAF